MKKIILFVLFALLLWVGIKPVQATENYQTFQTLELQSGKLLENFTDEDYDACYKKVKKRTFFGWRIAYATKASKAKFVSETVFSYYNQGKTPITYNYSSSNTTVSKFSISATGSLSYTSNTTKKEFKNGLSGALKVDSAYSYQNTTQEEENLKIIIDPDTVANLRIVGEGKITNGAAALYFFWIRTHIGGFEYFVVTTQYPRLEVLPI